MNTKVLICKVFPIYTLIFVGAIGVMPQSPPFKYGVEYVCKKDQATERVVVRYCRRDSDRPGEKTHDLDNFCMVEYLDRPTSMPNIALYRSMLQSEIAAELNSCKDPATGKPPAGNASTTVNAGAADTSIAKALAAKVDINILGMRFGEPLRLRDCPLLQLGPLKQNCFPALLDLVSELAKDFGSGDLTADDVKTVTLIPSNCPSWVKDCTAYVTVHDGRLDGVSLLTNGRNAMNAVTKDLTAKYGKPTSIALKTFRPDVGNPFNYNQPSWTMPGLRVAYDVVLNPEDATDTDRASSKAGMVRIMTEAEYLRRKAKEKEPVKSKL